MTRVKICGVTRLEDASLAVALGAAAVGFVFWPRSPRAIDAGVARRIVDRLPGFVVRVGVFVNAPADEVARTVATARLDVAQLHGDERLEDYTDVGARVLRGVTLDSDQALAAAFRLPPDVMPLVDGGDRDRRGGTGTVADWDRAAALSAGRPMVLAGGLTAANIAQAVRHVRPWAVDVSSGVEEAPGVKSAARLRQFFAAVASSTEEQ